MRPAALEDSSRASLEAQASHLRRLIAAGETGLQELLDRVEAHIPNAPWYDIDHRDRDCRRS